MNTSAPQPSLAFTSRDLFLGVAVVAVLLGVYSTFGLVYAAPVALGIAIALCYWGYRSRRRAYLWAGGILMLPATGLTGIVSFIMIMFGIGPVHDQDDWPGEIRGFARIGQCDTSDVKVSCLESFIDSEYVWRQPFPYEKLPELVANGAFESIEPAAVSPNFFAAFPYLWRPAMGPNCEFYATTEFDPDGRGPDGEHYYLMHDRDRGLLYVWYKDNF